jgi:isopropylmalate/homocitrate/citramalate synthase
MNNLDREEIEKMATEGNQAALRLHWESSDDEPTEETAQTILNEIKERVAEGEYTEDELWDIAYICTEEDYQEEQQDLDEINLDK